MSTSYGKHVSKLVTPQLEQARSDQKENNAGGFVFTLDKWARLDRWLILGAEGGTYYVEEKALTKDNANVLFECLKEDGIRTVNRIVEISDAGRAPKNDPAIFALAIAAADENIETRKAALEALPKVCRIGTHLFHFAREVENFRRWGRGLRNAIAKWYLEKPVDRMAYDVVKYQQRDGWSHRDLLRLSHVVPTNPQQDAVFRYVTSGIEAMGDREVVRRRLDKTEVVSKYSAIRAEEKLLPKIIAGFELAKRETDLKKLSQIILDYGLTREMVPTSSLNHVETWEALLLTMPITAMVRNLGKMTQVGLLKPMNANTRHVTSVLRNRDHIRKARLHPLALLVALKTYQQGRGDKGKLTWMPVTEILDALDEAFYLAFETIEPTGKNTLLAIDVSGSMDGGLIASAPGITPRIASAAMAMATAKTERNWQAVGFSSNAPGEWLHGSGRSMHYGYKSGLTVLNISPKMRLDQVVDVMRRVPMGGTDCALPMLYAQAQGLEIDTFIVYTDNETWAGNIHPFQALRNYRQASGRKSKLIVVGMTASEFTIADPSDAGMLDCIGFDASAPAVMADFARG